MDARKLTKELSTACREGDIAAVRRLLEQGARPAEAKSYKRLRDGRLAGAPSDTPLGEAAWGGQLEIVELLLAANAAVDAVTHHNETPFLLAIKRGKLAVARRLSVAGADPNHVGAMGNAIACAASSSDRTPLMIAWLLELGIDPTVQVNGRDAFDWLAYDPKQLESKQLEDRERAETALAILQLLRRHWRGDATRLDEALARAAPAVAAREEAAKQRAAAIDSVAALVGDPDAFQREALKLIGRKVAKRHDELAEVARALLAQPQVIAHSAWPELIRALVALTVAYESLGLGSLDQVDGDESGAMDRYCDDRLSTIDIALEVLALPGAVARDGWADLLVEVCETKRRCVGVYSIADAEIAALFAVPAVAVHPRISGLLEAARRCFPYAGL